MKKKITIAILCIVSADCLCGCQIIKGGPRRGYLSEQDASEHMLKEIIQYTEEAFDREDFRWICEDNPGVYTRE